MTAEKAIRNHRKMWNWIAEQYELCNDEAFIPVYNLKSAYIQEHFPNESVKNHCFMCEYAQNQMCGDLDYDLLGCDDYHSYCLLDWGNNAPGYMCESYDSPYLDLINYFKNNSSTTCKNIDDVINRCRQIANLPVKKNR